VLSIPGEPESKYSEAKGAKREIKPEERYIKGMRRLGGGSRFCGVVESDA
jgi:hypothetical protein